MCRLARAGASETREVAGLSCDPEFVRVKVIRSPVPSAFFLPAEVKPLKSRLDRASAGKSGSPHQMLLVDGEVYDYWFGTLDAAQIEARIAAITGGTKYPGPRCTRLSDESVRVCAEPH